MQANLLKLTEVTDPKYAPYARSWDYGYFTLHVHRAEKQFNHRTNRWEKLPAFYYIYRHDSDCNVENGEYKGWEHAFGQLKHHAQVWEAQKLCR